MENFQPQKRRAEPVIVSTTPHAPPAARHSAVNENNGGYFYPESREEEQYKQSYGTFFENNNFILNPRSEHAKPPARSYYPPQDRDNGDTPPAARNLPYKFIPPLKNNGIGDYPTNTQLPPTKAAWWEAPALAALNAPAASLKSELPSARSLSGRGIDLNNVKLADGRLGSVSGQRLILGGNSQVNHPQGRSSFNWISITTEPIGFFFW